MYIPLSDISQLVAGDIVRRVNGSKDQQGVFQCFDEQGGLVLIHVIDLNDGSYVSDAGIIRPAAGDSLYRVSPSFSQSSKKKAALEILCAWTLYKKEPRLRLFIEQFVQKVYSPEQICSWAKQDMLFLLFVPIQQKFQIGRFAKKINWTEERIKRFSEMIASLEHGQHITYVAYIPSTNSCKPMFYSIGTSPHQYTVEVLSNEPFAFKPTHGGHIKALPAGKNKSGGTKYLVDAGSNFIGRGNKATLDSASDVVKALRIEYPSFVFEAVAGRAAFGSEQSY